MSNKNAKVHKHHIIPRYMGGNNSSSNLIEVTIIQHAMFHYCNYQLWNNEEDKIAWKTLTGQITIDEAKQNAIKLGSLKGAHKNKILCQDKDYKNQLSKKCKNSFLNSPLKEEIIKRAKNNQSKATKAAKTQIARNKQKQSLQKINHQQGIKNSMYGKMWITNGTKEGSYRINKTDLIPEGYYKGRVCK